MKSPRANRFCRAFFALFLTSAFAACGGGSGGGGSGGGGNPPSVPTGLTAVAGNNQVALTWNASAGATSYTLSRSTTSGGPYTSIRSQAGTAYTDLAVTNGTPYYYVVSASNANGASGNTAQVSATPTLPPPPPTPTGLAAVATSGQVALTWNASTGATSYNVGRSTTNGGPYTTIATPAASPYTDMTVTNGTTYYYVVAAVNAGGTSANSTQVSATPISVPPTPTGLAANATPGQVALTWNSSAGATSYKVGRSTVSGGPYTNLASPATNSYTDAAVTNGTTYYYVVAAVNAGGTSANSSQVGATPPASTTAVSVTVDVLADRHFISPYVYGVNFPPSAAYITNSNTPLVRWGGNASSTYNWKLGTDNADNDYFWEDFGFGALGNPADSDSAQFITDVKASGSRPLMTMAMLNWVAQSPETAGAGGNLHWTYSVSQDGACSTKVDPFNTDASVALKADCSTPFVASQAQLNRAYFPLLDDHTQACSSGNCVYRIDWVTDPTKGLAQAFGSGVCPVPYFSNGSCHFYNMDNEIDIWGSTHFDVHPNKTTYDELRDVFLTEGGKLKTWDPLAVRFGWASCCWNPYWNSDAGSADKQAHANIDFMPWWLNELYWNDQISGTRTLDVFDLHAYPETSGNGLSLSAQRVLALTDTHDWWDPTYTSQAWFGGVSVTNQQPNDHMPFRIPRVRAIANMIYPNTPVGFTEWNFAMAGESDFSTALADADAYGILGRERATYSTRWTAPDPSTPAYNSLLLYRNYDGAKSTFDPISVSASHNADPNLFSVYAATNASGNSLTLMVVNKDPANAAQTTFTLSHFTPSQVKAYTLSQGSPNSIVAGATQAWSSTMTFAPYSATLLVITGSSTPPASEWDLNPDAIMVSASGSTTLSPKLIGTATTVTLNTAVFDSFEGAAACNGGSISLTNPTIASGTPGTITLNAPASAGFCHFSVTAGDGTTKGGWLVVGKPAATLAKTGGDNQTGTVGTALPVALQVTLTPGSSGGSMGGASVFFTTSAGSLTNVAVGGEKVFTGPKVIAVTNGSGVAKVTLTLPAGAGPVSITAEGPFALGHPTVVPFSETAQ